MLKRRKFITSTLSTAAASLLPITIINSDFNTTKNHILKGKNLKRGDTIGLVAPGYAVSSDGLEHAKTTLRKMGFIPYHTDRIIGNYGYFSNTDTERAADLNEMFANPNVDGILCARGGYGCTRIMQMINYDIIKNNPKVFIGFSDITTLLNGFYKETGLVGFHGPVGTTLDNEYGISMLEQLVVNPKKNVVIHNSDLTEEQKQDTEYNRYVITPGNAEGIMVGGSLTLINALIGTPHEIDFTNKIVCIEDVEESPYRIDRMLTQLIEGKTFKNAAGLVLGVFAGCETTHKTKTFTLKEVITDRLEPLNIPTVYGMSFGHIPANFTFPIGVNAKLSTASMTLTITEKAVL
ncbi:muramoyltetrapeptide carboxypeptidase [Cellulophaga sp. RHA19]|uniref:S66 peptidase family protein n=1 Tax=Cellulophaga sp. RHA19 TaxID=1798237 RepID=UPI000C2B81A5|nr:LD-carboxypeptidase [Cellulophaga sp. RHA19]PKB43757.1 muramoyltetrapeptide carboxypeptidase [Cellulophaga sp. RHA19]